MKIIVSSSVGPSSSFIKTNANFRRQTLCCLSYYFNCDYIKSLMIEQLSTEPWIWGRQHCTYTCRFFWYTIIYNPIVCDGRCGIIKKILNYNSRLIVFIRTALGESQAIAFEKYWHSPPNIAIFNWETKIKIRIHQFVKFFSMSYYFKKDIFW